MSDPGGAVMDPKRSEAGTHPSTDGFLPGQSDVSTLTRSDIQSEDTEWLWPPGEHSRITRISEPE